MKRLILLYNQSTKDIFCDYSLLRDITKVGTTLKFHTNGGIYLNEKGQMKERFDCRKSHPVVDLVSDRRRDQPGEEGENGQNFNFKGKE